MKHFFKYEVKGSGSYVATVYFYVDDDGNLILDCFDRDEKRENSSNLLYRMTFPGDKVAELREWLAEQGF